MTPPYTHTQGMVEATINQEELKDNDHGADRRVKLTTTEVGGATLTGFTGDKNTDKLLS